VFLQAEVDALADQLYSLAGRRFNLNSPRECSAVIYEELGLKPQGAKGAKKTKSGFTSTST
jgi:DNA polymerase-1